MTPPRAAVVGSCNVDVVVSVERLPGRGETVLGGDPVRRPGGKGANQALAARRWGSPTHLVASVGEDADGSWLLSNLSAHGVEVGFCQRSTRPTGVAYITVEDEGENLIVVAPGANNDVRVPPDLDVDLVLCQLEIAVEPVLELLEREIPVVLNASPAGRASLDLLGRCSVVVVNEHEASTLDLAILEHCVVTRGRRGAALFHSGREVASVPAPPVQAVDTVGAGDVFCAAYALEWARGVDPVDALRRAVYAGAYATTQPGAQGALPTREEVVSWIDADS